MVSAILSGLKHELQGPGQLQGATCGETRSLGSLQWPLLDVCPCTQGLQHCRWGKEEAGAASG